MHVDREWHYSRVQRHDKLQYKKQRSGDQLRTSRHGEQCRLHLHSGHLGTLNTAGAGVHEERTWGIGGRRRAPSGTTSACSMTETTAKMTA